MPPVTHVHKDVEYEWKYARAVLQSYVDVEKRRERKS